MGDVSRGGKQLPTLFDCLKALAPAPAFAQLLTVREAGRLSCAWRTRAVLRLLEARPEAARERPGGREAFPLHVAVRHGAPREVRQALAFPQCLHSRFEHATVASARVSTLSSLAAVVCHCMFACPHSRASASERERTQ